MAAADQLFTDPNSPADVPDTLPEAPSDAIPLSQAPTFENLFPAPAGGAADLVSPTESRLNALRTGVLQGIAENAAALNRVAGNKEAERQMLDLTQAQQPGAIVNPNDLLSTTLGAVGRVAPTVAPLMIPGVGEAMAPVMIGQGLVSGPMEADYYNDKLASLKAANPDDPGIQAMKPLSGAALGVTGALQNAIFMKLGGAGGNMLTPVLQRESGALLQGIMRGTADTGSNLAMGALLDALNPNMSSEEFRTKWGTAQGLAAAIGENAPFAAPGAVHGFQEARARGAPILPEPKPIMARVTEPGGPPPLPAPPAPPMEQPTPVQAAAAVPNPADRADLSLAPQTLDMKQSVEAAAPKETPPIPQVGRALDQLSPGELLQLYQTTQNITDKQLAYTELKRRGWVGPIGGPEPPPVIPAVAPAEPPRVELGDRVGFLLSEMERDNPAALKKLQEDAENNNWGDVEFHQALEEAVAKNRAAEAAAEPTTTQDEKGSTQEADERDAGKPGEAAPEARPEPDTVNQVRPEPGNANVEPGAGEQVREPGVERPSPTGEPVREPVNVAPVQPEPNAPKQVRRGGKRRARAEKQPVLTGSEAVLPPTGEEPVQPRPGSLATPEGQAAVKSAGEPKGAPRARTTEELEDSLEAINPEALADLQRQKADGEWADPLYREALKGRLREEASGELPEAKPTVEGEPPPAPKAPAKKQKPVRTKQTDLEKELSIDRKAKELRRQAKIARRKGDEVAAQKHEEEAAQWEAMLDNMVKKRGGLVPELKANVAGEGDEPAAEPGPKPPPLPGVRMSPEEIQAAANKFREQEPNAPHMEVIHSDNVEQAVSPRVAAKFRADDAARGGRTRAFVDPETEKVYLLSDRLGDKRLAGGVGPEELGRILHEENIGHIGIEGALRRSGGDRDWAIGMDHSFNSMVAEGGPMAREFARLARSYNGKDWYEVANDPIARRQVMAELIAHNAHRFGKDRPWMQRAWDTMKRVFGRAFGTRGFIADEHLRNYVDAGRKYNAERTSEGWDMRDLDPSQREAVRANIAEWNDGAQQLDDSLTFRRYNPTSSINENPNYPGGNSSHWNAQAITDALRTGPGSSGATLRDGSLDANQLQRQLNQAYRREKSLGRDIEIPKSLVGWQKGGEHYYRYDPYTDRYLKFTTPRRVGLRLTARPDGSLYLGADDLKGYIKRIQDWNDYFHDDIRVHGMGAFRDGQPAVVTSQPNWQDVGRPDPHLEPGRYEVWRNAMEDLIDQHMRNGGFEQVSYDPENRASVYYSPKENVVLGDVKPENASWVRNPDGTLQTRLIDGAIERGGNNPVVQRARLFYNQIKAGDRGPTEKPEHLKVLQFERAGGAPLPGEKPSQTLSEMQESEAARLQGTGQSTVDRAMAKAQADYDKGMMDASLQYGKDAGILSSSGPTPKTLSGPQMTEKDYLDSLLPRISANVAPRSPEEVDRTNKLNYSKLDESLVPPNAVQRQPVSGSLQSAAQFLRARDQERKADVAARSRPGVQPQPEPGLGERYRNEKRDLIEWAKAQGRVIPREAIARGENVGGNEHDVYFDQPTQRWLKVTQDGQMGFKPYVRQVHQKGIADTETRLTPFDGTSPIDYLERMEAANKLFGDDRQFHGITLDPATGQMNMVTSQPHYESMQMPDSPQAASALRQIQRMIIDRQMKEKGFAKIGREEYYHPESKTTVMDARPANVAVSPDGEHIMPFDVMVSNGDKRVTDESERMLKQVQEGKANFDAKKPNLMDMLREAPPPNSNAHFKGPERIAPELRAELRANVAPLEDAHDRWVQMGRAVLRRLNPDVDKVRDALDYGLDARDNIAANMGVRAENEVAAHIAANGGNRVKNSPEAKLEREAVLHLVEAGFGKDITTPEELQEAFRKLQLNKIRVDNAADPNGQVLLPPGVERGDVQEAAKRLKPAMDKAWEIATTDHVKAMNWAAKVHQEFQAQRALMAANGLPASWTENYVRRIIEQDPDERSAYAMPGAQGGGAAGFDRSQNQTRRFDTAVDAMNFGKKLAVQDVAGLVGKGAEDTAKAITNKQLFDKFRQMQVPNENRPVIGQGRKTWNPKLNGGKGGVETIPPEGPYKLVQGPAGERLYVDKEFAPYFENMLAPSSVRNNAFLAGILHTAADMKHGILLFDTFHVGRVMARLANLLAQSRGGKGLGEFNIPREILSQLGITKGPAEYGTGRTALDFDERTLKNAENLGWITPQDAQWARDNQKYVRLAEQSGYNVAGNLDNLYERAGKGLLHEVLNKIGYGDKTVGKGIETFNKWVFQKMTRNAMMIGWKEAYQRNASRFPDMTPQEVARQTSKEMNEYFGNLGRQGIFKSATAQDVARMVMLAPQWANSMIASQARGIGQLGSFAGGLLHGEAKPIGNVGAAMGVGYLGMLMANQVINLITKGQPTWDNEEGHKLDAYIPGGKNGFYLNPASIVAEELHTLQRYVEGGAEPGEAVQRLGINKMSPLARAAFALGAGRDAMNRPIAPGNRLSVAAKSLNPLPIFAGPAAGQLFNPELAQKGDWERQLAGSIGVKLDRGQSQGQQLRNLAKSTVPEAFPKSESPGDYSALRAYVNNDNESKAKSEILDLLRKGKTIQELGKVFAPKPAGGSAAAQALLVRREPARAPALIRGAMQETGENARKLATILQSIDRGELIEAAREGQRRKVGLE